PDWVESGCAPDSCFCACPFRKTGIRFSGTCASQEEHAMPIEIEGHGWELHVKRIGLQSHPGSRVRTLGSYQVFIDGQPVSQLSGHICECTGPGDNKSKGKKDHLRIKEGRYPLSTQFGKRYRSIDFTKTTEHPLPGFLLLETELRTAILV